jgi:hypothetical protein
MSPAYGFEHRKLEANQMLENAAVPTVRRYGLR